MGYSSSLFPPAIGDEFNGIGDCMVWRNFLLAHAAAYKVYTNSFRSYQHGKRLILIRVINQKSMFTHLQFLSSGHKQNVKDKYYNNKTKIK